MSMANRHAAVVIVSFRACERWVGAVMLAMKKAGASVEIVLRDKNVGAVRKGATLTTVVRATTTSAA